MFYTYRQNNSGGRFQFDNDVAPTVIIEAVSDDAADLYAIETLGMYFDGCLKGMDCECCGDRWYPSPEGDPVPSLSNEPIQWDDQNLEDVTNGYIYFADGSRGYFNDGSRRVRQS